MSAEIVAASESCKYHHLLTLVQQIAARGHRYPIIFRSTFDDRDLSIMHDLARLVFALTASMHGRFWSACFLGTEST